MSMIHFLTIANVVLSLAVTGFLIFALLRFGQHMNECERLGLSMAAGACLMTVVPILGSLARIETPFDQWAGLLFRVGVLMFAAARRYRFAKHERRNDAARVAATEYLKGRGKL